MKLKTLCIYMGLGSAPLLAADVSVTANITTNTTWTANNTYLLDKPIFVTNGATLTIQPGTTILGEENIANSTFGSLVITRDARLVADGTADAPIVFTARAERDGFDDDEDPLTPDVFPVAHSGDASFWGGVIMLGRAQVNNYSGASNTGEARIEGFPNSGDLGLITYGGTDNVDDSGILRYVSIRFGGFEFAANNEINGLTLGGVGSGTIIENVEIVANSDDGVEFFGGTVNTKRLAVAFAQDESFDIDQGHAGYHQFWFSIQAPNGNLGDYGGEWDGGFGTTISGTPYTTTSIYNMTMLGTGVASGGSVDDAIQVSDNFAGTLANSVLHDFNGAGLSNTGDGIGSPKPTFNNNTWGSFVSAGLVPNIGVAGATNPAGTGNGAIGVNPLLVGISRIANGGLDPRPQLGSPLYTSPLSSFPAGAPAGFFTEVNYRGAFGGSNWLNGWTYLSQKGYLSGLPDVGGGSGGTGGLADADNDGISDAVESANTDLGFNPAVSNGTPSTIFDDLYTEGSILDLVAPNQVIVQKNANNTVTLSLDLFRSTNLVTPFAPAPALQATFPATEPAEFYRIEIPAAE